MRGRGPRIGGGPPGGLNPGPNPARGGGVNPKFGGGPPNRFGGGPPKPVNESVRKKCIPMHILVNCMANLLTLN